jgi:hypothetical protein
MARPVMDMISSRRWMSKAISIRCYGRSIGTIAAFADFGMANKAGGADRGRWVFDYSDKEDDDDETGYRFEAHAFWPGEYVSISGQDRKLHTFRVVTVDPVVLSMALIKSFELQVKV